MESFDAALIGTGQGGAPPAKALAALGVETDKRRYVCVNPHLETSPLESSPSVMWNMVQPSPTSPRTTAVLQMDMVGGVPCHRIRDGVFSHPTLSESLNNLFMQLD